jgi:Ca2+/Na+ antiporter
MSVAAESLDQRVCDSRMTVKKKYFLSQKFLFNGNIFVLIVLTLLFFPWAILYLVHRGSIKSVNSIKYIAYDGSWGWLYFWLIMFFPLCFLLFLFKGSSTEKSLESKFFDEQPHRKSENKKNSKTSLPYSDDNPIERP